MISRLNLLRFGWLCCFWFAFPTVAQELVAQEPPKLAPWTPERMLVSSALGKWHGRLIVPAAIGQEDGLLGICFLSDHSFVNSKRTRGLKKLSSGNVDESDCYAAPSITIKGTSLKGRPYVGAMDFPEGGEGSAKQVDGILGLDYLASWVFHLDPDNDVVHLSYPSADHRPPGKSIPILIHEGKPYVQVEFPSGARANFILDVLDHRTYIRQETLNELGLLDGVAQVGEEPFLDDEGNEKTRKFYRLGAIKAFGATAKNLTFESKEENILGLNFLLRYRLSIDFKNERLYAEPSWLHAARDRSLCDGMIFASNTEEVVVIGFDPDSLAQKKGVRLNDRIMSVNGFVFGKEDMQARNELRQLSWKPTMLKVVRDGKDLEIELPGESMQAAQHVGEGANPEEAQGK